MRIRTTALALLAGLGVASLGCGRPRGEEAPAPAGPVATPKPGVMGTATVSGRVLLAGPAPAVETFRMTGDSWCAKAHEGEVSREDLLVSAEGGVANAFVYLSEGVTGAYPPPAAPAVLDQKGCRYRPRVLGLVAGQALEIVNSDETIHNVHAVAEKNPSFNLGMPLPNLRERRAFSRPEIMVRMKCDVHSWMSAWIGVVAHPFFAVSGEDGSFTVSGVPAGSYVLRAWHERLGQRTLAITLAEGESRPAEIVLEAAAASPGDPRGSVPTHGP